MCVFMLPVCVCLLMCHESVCICSIITLVLMKMDLNIMWIPPPNRAFLTCFGHVCVCVCVRTLTLTWCGRAVIARLGGQISQGSLSPPAVKTNGHNAGGCPSDWAPARLERPWTCQLCTGSGNTCRRAASSQLCTDRFTSKPVLHSVI